jgi:amino acid transporter
MGFFFIKPTLLSFSHWPRLANVFFGAGIVFVAYEGFGLITNAAEDMENPRKTLPRALYLSVILVIIIYAAICLTVLGNLPLAGIIKAKEYALAAAAKPFLGLVGFKIVAIAALFSTSSAINATLYGGANVSYMLAKEGELPRIFERKIWGKSSEGLFITAGLVILLINLFNLESIALLGSASFLLIYAAVNLAHLRLCRDTGASPYLIWASIIGCFASLGVLVYYELAKFPLTVVILVAVFFLSFVVEGGYRKYSRRLLKTRTG